MRTWCGRGVGDPAGGHGPRRFESFAQGCDAAPEGRPRGDAHDRIEAAVTARRFPDEPVFGSSAEQLFAEALQEQLPDDAVLFCNVRFSDGRQDREADLVVAWPGVGVAVVEVKGGSVSLDRGEWRQRQDGVDTLIHPVDQAVACKYLLCDYLAEHPRWSAGRPRTAHLVAVPATTLPGDFMAPGLARWMALDKTDVSHAAVGEARSVVGLPRRQSVRRVRRFDHCPVLVLGPAGPEVIQQMGHADLQPRCSGAWATSAQGWQSGAPPHPASRLSPRPACHDTPRGRRRSPVVRVISL